MGEFKGAFGLTRILGRGEGRDELYDASAKPAEGMHNFIEVVVNAKGPSANDSGSFGRGQAYIPAGSVVKSAQLINNSDKTATLTVSLVKADGTDAKALFSAKALAANGTLATAGSEAGLIRVTEDRYVKATGMVAGLDATLLVEFI